MRPWSKGNTLTKLIVPLISFSGCLPVSSAVQFRTNRSLTSFLSSHHTSKLPNKTTPIHHRTRTRTLTRTRIAFQDSVKSRKGYRGTMKDTSLSGKGNDMDDASAYNSFVSASVDITQAYVRKGILTLVRSARDIDANTRRKYIHQILLPLTGKSGDEPCIVLPATELASDEKARIASPSGEKVAILKVDSSVPSKPKQMLEIWTERGTSLQRRIILPSKMHGAVCTDTAWFGLLSWNPQETAIVYSAEMNPPPTSSFFDSSPEEQHSDSKKESIAGGEYTLGLGKGEVWGEKYGSTSRLNLFIVNVDSGNVGLVSNAPGESTSTTTNGGYVLGQAIFSPCGKNIVYTAWDAGEGGSMPRRLGSIYCFQRASQIFTSPVTKLMENLSAFEDDTSHDDDEYSSVSDGEKLARSARFVTVTDSESKLVYLSNREGFDTHGGCMALNTIDWTSEKGLNLETKRTLVDVVHVPSHTGNGESTTEERNVVLNMAFPGIFTNQLLIEPCVSPDGKHLFLTTQWGSVSKIVRIALKTGNLSLVNFTTNGSDSNTASQSLLCLTKDGGAIVSISQPNRPPIIGKVQHQSLKEDEIPLMDISVIAKLPPITASAKIASSTPISDHENKQMHYDAFSLIPPYGSVKAPIQGILLLPSNIQEEKVPLIVVPHGGPHSCTSTVYTPSYAYLCQHGGYAILHCNYRGSSGFGQNALESLAGTAGSLDVEDVVHLTKHALASNDALDSSRVGVCGGSHGGFLSGHLIGQYPELFKVAAMRNPVTNIASMVTATDIPDWCYVETFGAGYYDWNVFRGPTKNELSAMWEASRKYFITRRELKDFITLFRFII